MEGRDEDETLPAPGEATAAAAAGTLAAGTLVAGRYRITRFLGEGAMGAVHAADDLVLGTTVALKTLRAELAGSAAALARFRREMMLARRVTSAHVCRLHDVGEHGAQVFLTMELLLGRTLAERLAHGARPSLAEVERLAAQLVDGLAALHAARVAHRDFKPGNVMLVDGDRRAVITDFGLARSTVDGDPATTAVGALLGTPAYMAPEQVEGRAATPASDVYALGITLFELLTGVVPFREDTALATATARLHRAPPRPSSLRPEVPARWDAIVGRCLARDPLERGLVVDVLAARPGWPRRRVVIAGAGALAAIGLGGWRWLDGRGSRAAEAPGPAPITDDDRVAVLALAGDGELLDDPWRLALTVDLHDALTTTGLPLLALDSDGYVETIDGTIAQLAGAPLPAVAAWTLAGVVAVVQPALVARPDLAADDLVVDVTIGRRGAPAWIERFRRPAREATLLVDDLARAIAARLGARAPWRPADTGVHDPAAYLGYAAALPDLCRKRGRAPLEALVAARPELHRAAARLALRLAEISQRGEHDQILPDTRQAVALADRVLAADPAHPIALTARGVAALTLYDWPTADRSLARALELAPAHTRVAQARAYQLMYQGRFDEHHRVADRRRALNPLVDPAPSTAWSYVYARRYADAARYIPTVLARPSPRPRRFLRVMLASSYAELARFDEAVAIADQFADDDDPYLRASLVVVYVLAGQVARARAMRAQIGTRGGAEAGALMDDALGDIDAALAGLEACVDGHFVEALYLKIERFTPALRSHPRFQALIRRVGLPP